MRDTHSAKSGFSLVELSIVLVILGLLTGGILAGQSLIRASELRAVISEFQKYQSAVNTFKDKYFALPGDMTNATSFWGLLGGNATADDPTCNAIAATDTKTCNGNGNGIIDAYDEARFWQHLANAGLIEGQYTGVYGATGATLIIPGTNMARSKLGSAAFWQPQWEGTHSGEATRFDSSWQYGNSFFFSDWQTTWKANLTPAEAWNMDKKLDDGIPYSGRIVNTWGAFYSNSGEACTTATSSADFTATYNLGASGKNCQAYFVNAF